MSEYLAHFNVRYQGNSDPWVYQTSACERQKDDATLAALTRSHYTCAIEAGCSIGVLSARLAPRCDRLFALDLSARAVGIARDRLRPYPGVAVLQALSPDDWVKGDYDLFLMSEIIYYLSRPDIVTLAEQVAQDARPGAECVIVQYQGDTQTPVMPDEARAIFCDRLAGLRRVTWTDHPTPGDYNHRTVMFATD